MKNLNDELCIVVLSGGQDSTTCLAWAIRKFGYKNVEAITFDYGQRHRTEIEQAKKIAMMFCCAGHNLIETDLFKQLNDSALLNNEIDIAGTKDDLPASFVPGRNIFFLLLTAIISYKKNIKNIVTGVCQTDYSGYPDCRRDSIKAIELAINLCMETDFIIHTPIMNLTKAETFALADSLGYHELVIDHSMTCYEGMKTKNPWGYGCGECPACKLREKGFNEYSRQKA